MRNFIQAGNTVVVPAPYALTSGQGAKVGQLFGVATNDAALSADVALDLTGVFELTKIGSQRILGFSGRSARSSIGTTPTSAARLLPPPTF